MQNNRQTREITKATLESNLKLYGESSESVDNSVIEAEPRQNRGDTDKFSVFARRAGFDQYQ
jgi:hypothetical protein